MLTLRSAASLLAAAHDLERLVPIAAALGFTARPLPLDDRARDALGLGVDVGAAAVVRGPGALRALLLETRSQAPLRDVVRALGARIATRAPHLLWLLVVADRAGDGVALAAWSGDRNPPRVAALHARRSAIVPSDAETLRALVAVPTGDADVLVHQRWLDLLGREALTRRFYRALEARVHDLADRAEGRAGAEERGAIALLCVSRLLFLAFLEAKGWLDGDHGFLARTFERFGGAGYHRRVLDPLLFGTLNTPPSRRAPAARAFGRVPYLNGGLFARTPLERRAGLRFPDDALGPLFGELLGRYRFTAREDDGSWSEAAVDPEMLGRAFESLMAPPDRKSSGAFYTPQPLVEHVTRLALREALAARDVTPDEADAALDGARLPDVTCLALRERVDALRLLDPACGSGAFLVHALERLATLRAILGDARPLAELRRETLSRTIFGVDVNPTAVWLCELRLWLSVVIESDERDPLRVPALPNLDRQVRVGDALLGGGFDGRMDARAGRRLAALRARYARATGPRKTVLLRRLDAEERARALAALDSALARANAARRELVLASRARDLFGERAGPGAAERRRLRELRAQGRALRRRRHAVADGGALPFLFAAHFADVAAGGGFDAVVGNPPWVRPHHVPPTVRETLRREFRVARDAGWATGAAACAGRGFAAQVDLAALFAERSLGLLRSDGALALLLPAKLWRSLAGGGLRRLLSEEARVVRLEDWASAPVCFDAAVYPSVLVARRAPTATPGDASAPSSDACVTVVVRDRERDARWAVRHGELAFDRSPGSPWLLAPPAARAAFDRLTSAGTPLADSTMGRPLLGVKCGANEAFVVTVCDSKGALALVEAGIGAARRSGRVERALLRPLVRGEDVAPWQLRRSAALLWTHGDDGEPLAELPPHAAAWLAPWRRRLAARADVRARSRWWTLFRTDGAACDLARVAWSDVGRAPRAAVIEPGDDTVPLNSCYVVRCRRPDDAHTLAALLNGPLLAAWLERLAEPARGGYRRFLGWTVALAPLPRDWRRAVHCLAPLGRRAADGRLPASEELLEAALAAYGLSRAAVAPLLEPVE